MNDRFDDFNGQRYWLDIDDDSPTFYQLLAIDPGESDPEIIRRAAVQRRKLVQSKRGSGHDSVVSSLLYQIGEAETTLLSSSLREDYDRRLAHTVRSRADHGEQSSDAFEFVDEIEDEPVDGGDLHLKKLLAIAGTAALLLIMGFFAWPSNDEPLDPAAANADLAAADIDLESDEDSNATMSNATNDSRASGNETVTNSPVTARRLRELNTLGDERGPWVSSDGLTIYWWVRPDPNAESEIWTASRLDAQAVFSRKRLLRIGEAPTFTGDQLEMVFLPGRDEDLKMHVAARSSREDEFGPATEIPPLRELNCTNPSLSSDGLMLLVEQRESGSPLLLTRPTREQPWREPVPLPTGPFDETRLKSLSLGENGLRLYATLAADSETESSTQIARSTRSTIGDPFAQLEVARVAGVGFDLADPYSSGETDDVYFVSGRASGDLWRIAAEDLRWTRFESIP
ncbi:hypothetical protein [Rubinisphaera margarita]|uniref:hypothetical protein n=1 Tax=Rubinisphaera margarita TaxID=2909586 RepID=UPI001EE92426|nr:hypothetical protein [Rubinisphaera margarita]MCG6155493.1 hypothetical protein [Rubinisphaera margarita]